MTRNVILLMGPTASGKTDIAIELCKRFPCEIISVDSAMIYRGMDIGTAKPDRDTLRRVPHRLVDIRDPEESYSAGEFVRDARSAIDAILAQQRIPLLVGGTMLYFRSLTGGIAEMPPANAAIRKEIDDVANHSGWPKVHEQLAAVDPAAAARINPNDSQRIQRALEVYLSSGKALSQWQQQTRPPGGDLDFLKIGLQLEPRARLHERIEARLNHMVENGFLEELCTLRARPGLSPALSFHAVCGLPPVLALPGRKRLAGRGAGQSAVRHAAAGQAPAHLAAVRDRPIFCKFA